MDTVTTLDFEEFDDIRQLIRERSGIWLNDTKVMFLQSRVQGRLQALDLPSSRNYYHLLKYESRGRSEIQHLVDAVTVNESWFFREAAPIQAWITQVLPGLMARPAPVRVWSAGCASGEEPYSLAMLLVSALGHQAASKIEILATDINLSVLAAAQTGIYSAYSLRHASPEQRQNFFTSLADGRFQMRPEIRQLVRFKPMNLSALVDYRRIPQVDLLLCRNTLIYFEEEQRKITLQLLYQSLRPGGHLVLGHSESLLHQVTPFKVARFDRHIVYGR